MFSQQAEKLKREIEEIDTLIEYALENDFLSDNIYTKITTKIGILDDAVVNANYSPEEQNYLAWVKARLDKICKMLLDEYTHGRQYVNGFNDDLMHPTGDYFNEDNSIVLSPKVKDSLKKILQDKYTKATI